MKKLSMIIIPALLVLLMLNGCGGKSSSEFYLREEVSLDFINQIAVLPFQNHSKDQFADERARDVAITQILAMRISDVVDKGIVDSIINEEAIDISQPLDLINLNRLGQRLNAQAFLLGSIDDAGEVRKGAVTFPEVAMTLRLVDAKASVVLWQSSGRWTGESMMGKLFGVAPTDNFHITMKLMRKLLSTIPATK